ncbi:hypothetical protein MJL79_29935, partial [Salmonella enterica subsp. enterica serovar Montevideo]|nr:hypothetical protein [Salmonella enterica subsp. enterica serovar Montevideo]
MIENAHDAGFAVRRHRHRMESMLVKTLQFRCYYLMATRGLKKPRGRTVALAFDEGIVGLVGRLAEPINLAD